MVFQFFLSGILILQGLTFVLKQKHAKLNFRRKRFVVIICDPLADELGNVWLFGKEYRK